MSCPARTFSSVHAHAHACKSGIMVMDGKMERPVQVGMEYYAGLDGIRIRILLRNEIKL